MSRPRPAIENLVAQGRLVAQAADIRALEAMIDEADRDIAAADANVNAFGSWADAMLYESGLRSARVIVMAGGFRIVARDRAHVSTIDAADELTEGAHHAVFVRLHRMRRRRNEFMYEASVDPTVSDIEQARKDITLLLELARQAVAKST